MTFDPHQQIPPKQLSLCCPCGEPTLFRRGLCLRCYHSRRRDRARFAGGRERVLARDHYLCRVCQASAPHGFRSTFRDWAGEETDHPREVIEAALAQVVRNRVEAAYARSDLFERWRVLMDDWAAYLHGEHRPDTPRR